MSSEIAEMARSSGIVGAGGAGFPTHMKLTAKVDTYIVNAAECEPLLRVDQQLMQKYPEKLVSGLQLGMKATGAKKGIIAIKRKYKSAIKKIKQAIKTDSRLELFLLEDVYPAGDEHVLVYEILGKVIPESGLPIDIGAMVNNVYTLINLVDASEGKSIVSRYITVTGAVKNPVTMDFPIGTAIIEVIKSAG